MTLKGKREKVSATPPVGEVIKRVWGKINASLAPLAARIKPYWLSLPKLHRTGVTVLAVLLVILLLWPASDKAPVSVSNERVTVQLNVTADVQEDTAFEDNSNKIVQSQTVDTEWVNYEVKRGDTLSNIFRDQNLPLPDLYAISAIEGKDKPLSRIQPGQLLRFKRSPAGELDMLQIETTGSASVIFFRLSDGSFARRE